MITNIDEKLVKKYTNGFMYVDYPHKSIWNEKIDNLTYKTALKKLFLDAFDHILTKI